MESFPHIELTGSAYERGVKHGSGAPERVARSAKLYRTQMQQRGIAQEEQFRLARNFMPVIEAYDPSYLEEMRGIAKGADVALEDIVTINCRTEMMYGYNETSADDEVSDGCTGIVILPEASANGHLLHAHNWDWLEECAGTGVVLHIRNMHGPDIMTFCEAGGLARHGFNSDGVAVTGNFLSSDRDYREAGQAPLGLVRRKMLECTSLDSAMVQLWNKSRYCSNNVMISQADGEAVNLECAPDEIFWSLPDNGILVHTNHWICSVARAKLRDLELAKGPHSLYRQRRTMAALQARAGDIDLEMLKTVLSDEYGSPASVLRSPKPGSFNNTSTTVATTLMDPGDGVMWMACKPYENRTFVEYRL